MHPMKTALIALNVVGGVAVLASYAWGVRALPTDALWGGVPGFARPLYTVNMGLAAAGYFAFTGYIVLRLDPAAMPATSRFGYGAFPVLYALVLLPSAAWLPLTAAWIASPAPALWAAVRLDLALVAIGSLGLLAALLALPGDAPPGRGLAIAGLVPFCIQTALLDALVWPALFPSVR